MPCHGNAVIELLVILRMNLAAVIDDLAARVPRGVMAVNSIAFNPQMYAPSSTPLPPL